jgi:hypothetical protein
MITKQPEALRLAECLDTLYRCKYTEMKRAAAQLLRLHEVNAELVEALRPFSKFACDPPCGCYNCVALSAIAKATGEQ